MISGRSLYNRLVVPIDETACPADPNIIRIVIAVTDESENAGRFVRLPGESERFRVRQHPGAGACYSSRSERSDTL